MIVVVMNLKDFIVKFLEALYSGQFRFWSEFLAITQ